MTKKKRDCIVLISNSCKQYIDILKLQSHIVLKKIKKELYEDVLIITEHYNVYTLGKNGKKENLLVDNSSLKQNNIEIFYIERGGDITYHGPGQIVAYPIFNLKNPQISIKDFVTLLEEVMIKTGKYFHVSFTRNQLNRGVWYGEKKVGSIGIAIKRGITYHGLALNINTDLTFFSWINPCGLNNIEITSLKKIMNKSIKMEEARKALLNSFVDIFNLKIKGIKPINSWDVNDEQGYDSY